VPDAAERERVDERSPLGAGRKLECIPSRASPALPFGVDEVFLPSTEAARGTQRTWRRPVIGFDEMGRGRDTP
jgi:hypothetical protein